MKKIVFTSIAMAAVSFMTFAQKDTIVKPQVIKDTIKTKLTGAVSIELMLAYAEDDSTKKVKPVQKPVAPKPDTLKTGSLKKTATYALFTETPGDSSKTKVKSDTIKSDTKNTTGYYGRSVMLAVLDDSTKKVVKPDTTISKPAAPQKRTGAMYFDKKTGSIMAMPKSYTEEV